MRTWRPAGIRDRMISFHRSPEPGFGQGRVPFTYTQLFNNKMGGIMSTRDRTRKRPRHLRKAFGLAGVVPTVFSGHAPSVAHDLTKPRNHIYPHVNVAGLRHTVPSRGHSKGNTARGPFLSRSGLYIGIPGGSTATPRVRPSFLRRVTKYVAVGGRREATEGNKVVGSLPNPSYYPN
jgi:hypothetical protein